MKIYLLWDAHTTCVAVAALFETVASSDDDAIMCTSYVHDADAYATGVIRKSTYI